MVVVGLLVLVGGAGDQGEPGAGEDIESEVAAPIGPFVVLFGQDGADQSDDRCAVGEDPDAFTMNMAKITHSP